MLSAPSSLVNLQPTPQMATADRLPFPIDDREIQEATLVRLVINALQGVKSALDDIEKLSTVFCSNPADRTFHQIHSLWHRSSSTTASAKTRKLVGQSSLVFFLLRKFVDYFLGADFSIRGESRGDEQKRKELGLDNCPPQSLVDQAFSVAVGKVLEGYLCALKHFIFFSADEAIEKCRRAVASAQVFTTEEWEKKRELGF